MAKQTRVKPASRKSRPPSAAAARGSSAHRSMQLWPENLPVQPWQQPDGMSCTAFAIGAAAWWIEWKKAGTDPGTPDFSFLYNNEEFLSARIVSEYLAAERQGLGAPTPSEPGFRLRIAARAAGIFGVPIGADVPAPADQSWWSLVTAPSAAACAAARACCYDNTRLFAAPPVDPNDPALPAVRKAPALARHAVVRAALLAGTPVVACHGLYACFPSGSLPPLTRPMPAPLGYHAVLITGFADDACVFLVRDSNTMGSIGGGGQLPYSWVDDPNATIGFTTLAPADGGFRPSVTLDRVRITNRTATTARVSVRAFDGTGTYLGHMPYGAVPCTVGPGRSVVLSPVRWLGAYRLLVSVGPSGAAPTLELLVDDPDGAVPSGAEIVIPSGKPREPKGWFVRADGRRLRTTTRTLVGARTAATS